MSWTDSNKTEPQSSWGQGSVNNGTGWGKAANNLIGWAVAHLQSWGHAITNLTGIDLFPTDLLNWSQIFNDAYQLNSGTWLEFVAANGDQIAFADLTGVTITSQVGSANLAIIGNDLVPSNDGQCYEFTLSNGNTFDLFQTSGSTIYPREYATTGITGTIYGATPITGSAYGEQMYEWGSNGYDYFNGVNNAIRIEDQRLNGTTINFSIVLGSVAEQQVFEIKDLTEGTKAALTVNTTNGGNAYWAVSKVTIASSSNKYNSFIENTVIPIIGNKYDVSITFNSGEGVSSFTVNQSLGSQSNAARSRLISTDMSGIQSSLMIRESVGFQTSGIMLDFEWDEVSHNTFNNWNGGTKVGTFTKEYITGATKEATTDIFGQTINSPAIANFYNAPEHANHYAQIEATAGATVDTSSAMTSAFWIKPKTNGTIYSNGAAKATYDGANLTFTRDGVTTITYAVAVTDFTYFAITSDASGVTDIYTGSKTTEPTIVVTGQSGGAATDATVPMYGNNINALTGRYEGYNQLTGFWSKELTPDEILQAYNGSVSYVPEATGNVWNDASIWNDNNIWND